MGISRRQRKLHVKYIDLIQLIPPFQCHAEIRALANQVEENRYEESLKKYSHLAFYNI